MDFRRSVQAAGVGLILGRQITDFSDKKVSLLLLHPVLVTVPTLHLLRLQLEVLVQPIQSLLLEVNFCLGTSVTDLLVLFQFEFVQVGVFGDRRQHLHRVVLLCSQIYHGFLF